MWIGPNCRVVMCPVNTDQADSTCRKKQTPFILKAVKWVIASLIKLQFWTDVQLLTKRCQTLFRSFLTESVDQFWVPFLPVVSPWNTGLSSGHNLTDMYQFTVLPTSGDCATTRQGQVLGVLPGDSLHWRMEPQ